MEIDRVPIDKRKVSGSERKYDFLEVQYLHKEICRRIILGQNNKEIASALHITPQTVCLVKNSTITKRHLDHLEDKADDEVVKVRGRIKAVSVDAMKILEQVVSSDSMNNPFYDTPVGLKIKVAQDLLDRGGHSAKRLMEVDINTHNKDNDWVGALVNAADTIDKEEEKDNNIEEEESDFSALSDIFNSSEEVYIEEENDIEEV